MFEHTHQRPLMKRLAAVNMRRILLCAAIAFSPMFMFAQGHQSQAFGIFGDSLESAEQTEFFHWFSLEKVGETRDASGLNVVEFRPSGEKFNRLVGFKVTCDSVGHLQALQLEIHREFIDSPQEGVFAADLAKSFLLGAFEDRSKVEGLAAEIEYGSHRASKRPILVGSDNPTPSIPERPSPAYATYLGKQQQWELPVSGMHLGMKNENRDGVAVLIINLGKPPP